MSAAAVWLDLTNAFGSVLHKLILFMLETLALKTGILYSSKISQSDLSE